MCWDDGSGVGVGVLLSAILLPPPRLCSTNLTKSQGLSEPLPARSPSSSEFLLLSLAPLLLVFLSFFLFPWTSHLFFLPALCSVPVEKSLKTGQLYVWE